jgi:hypothetical protein
MSEFVVRRFDQFTRVEDCCRLNFIPAKSRVKNEASVRSSI